MIILQCQVELETNTHGGVSFVAMGHCVFQTYGGDWRLQYPRTFFSQMRPSLTFKGRFGLQNCLAQLARELPALAINQPPSEEMTQN